MSTHNGSGFSNKAQPPVGVDSDDVQAFVTLGGQVAWANIAYRHTTEKQVDTEQQPQAAACETWVAHAPSDESLWDAFMQRETPADVAAGTRVVAQDAENASQAASRGVEETSSTVAPEPTTSDATGHNEPPSGQAPQNSAEDVAMNVDRTEMDPPLTVLPVTQTSDSEPDTRYSTSGHADPATLANIQDAAQPYAQTLQWVEATPDSFGYDTDSEDDPEPTFPECSTLSLKSTGDASRKRAAVLNPSAIVNIGQNMVANKDSSAPATPSADPCQLPHTSSINVSRARAAAAQSSAERGKGKTAARGRYRPYATLRPATLTLRVRQRRYSTDNPPEGWRILWGEHDATWRWNGRPIPASWAPPDIWEKLRAQFRVHGRSPCGWEGCTFNAGGQSYELRKHVVGVHVGCGAQCRGCGRTLSRWDNWSTARSGHWEGCPTDAFHRKEITLAELESQLAVLEAMEEGEDEEDAAPGEREKSDESSEGDEDDEDGRSSASGSDVGGDGKDVKMEEEEVKIKEEDGSGEFEFDELKYELE
ncbi:hypothetical protein BD413DRAFT_613198 [Trametes elegans]|nr:hypothetical protein BD413DRAFT_613198 [Trametes elegans]